MQTIFVYIFGKRKREELLTFARAPFAARIPYFLPHEFRFLSLYNIIFKSLNLWRFKAVEITGVILLII